MSVLQGLFVGVWVGWLLSMFWFRFMAKRGVRWWR